MYTFLMQVFNPRCSTIDRLVATAETEALRFLFLSLTPLTLCPLRRQSPLGFPINPALCLLHL